MRLKIIGSSSAGNAYVLYNGTEALLIEAGVRMKKIKEAMNFDLSGIVGCLISHEHGDHSKAVKDVLTSGIDVYSSYGTMKALGVEKHHRAHSVDNQPFRIGGYTVMTFDVKHDCADPVGFLIDHEETGLILFLTDSYFVPYTFPGLKNVIVEANFDQDLLDERVAAGRTHGFLRERIMSSHMSLETCKDLLRSNDLTQVNNIVLIHLSDSNSDEARFKREVYAETGKTVIVADSGMDIEFNKTPW